MTDIEHFLCESFGLDTINFKHQTQENENLNFLDATCFILIWMQKFFNRKQY